MQMVKDVLVFIFFLYVIGAVLATTANLFFFFVYGGY